MAHIEDEDVREQVCAWLTANGIDPADLPRNQKISYMDGQVMYLKAVRTPDGGVMPNPFERNSIMTTTEAAPVTVPPPPLVAEWLAPKCPTCGRF